MKAIMFAHYQYEETFVLYPHNPFYPKNPGSNGWLRKYHPS
jgi:hypothetical protein